MHFVDRVRIFGMVDTVKPTVNHYDSECEHVKAFIQNDQTRLRNRIQLKFLRQFQHCRPGFC